MILRRSRQWMSPAREEWTRPAAIAASRIIRLPRASQAAGTVSHKSAESARCASRQLRRHAARRGTRRTEVGDGADVARDLLPGVLPQAGEEVDDQVERLLVGLCMRPRPQRRGFSKDAGKKE